MSIFNEFLVKTTKEEAFELEMAKFRESLAQFDLNTMEACAEFLINIQPYASTPDGSPLPNIFFDLDMSMFSVPNEPEPLPVFNITFVDKTCIHIPLSHLTILQSIFDPNSVAKFVVQDDMTQEDVEPLLHQIMWLNYKEHREDEDFVIGIQSLYVNDRKFYCLHYLSKENSFIIPFEFGFVVFEVLAKMHKEEQHN